MIEGDWHDLFLAYLRSGTLPEDKVESQRLEIKVRAYLFVDDELYRRGGITILMKCISTTEGLELLKEIHRGICGNHASAKTLVGKVFRQGFYWPTAVNDVADVVRKCEGCQFFARQSRVPAHELRLLPMT